MLKEACVENFTDIPSVIEKGADRIELCDNLAVGGTTVSYGVMKKTLTYCRPKNVPVMAIIRPRGGDFVYTDYEKEMMLADIEMAVQLKADGLVIGALTRDNHLDLSFLEKISALVNHTDISLTFHMAFDQLSLEHQLEALISLKKLGFSRVLTHGGPKSQSIFNHVPHLKELMKHAPTGLTILPGGGVNKDNLVELQEVLSLEEVHGTRIV